MNVNKQIVSLALPTLATLLAEPLLVIVDSALVGRLGDAPLAGLSLASTILMTLVGLCIFLSYATTASTARYFGANKPAGAYRLGIDGLWLALGLGALLSTALLVWGDSVVSWFGPAPDVADQATRYVHASALGIPGMLLVLAATGVVRGALDVKTPLIVATTGTLINIPVSYLLIYPANLGIAGAGYGTALCQTGMGLTLAFIVCRFAHRHKVSLLPNGAGVLSSLSDSVPLIVRTLCLRAALVVTIAAATALGTTALAAHQVVNSLWTLTAFGLDALAIAAQALVGQSLGARDEDRVRSVLRHCLLWGLWVGVGLGVLVAATSLWIPAIITPSADVQALATWGLIVCGLGMPLGSLAFMLDGVLIGAGDTKYLAWSMFLSTALYAPVPLILMTGIANQTWGFIALWTGYLAISMGLRVLTLYLRTRGSTWIVLGERR